VRRLRVPLPWRMGPLAVMMVTAAGGLPARAAVKVTPGQELIYSGSAELKVTNPAGQSQTISGPVKISALATEADPSKGYAVILLRSFQPGQVAGQPKLPADSGLTTLRYGADLTPSGAPEGPSGASPVSALLQALRVPLAPRAELKAGDEWRQSEALPAMPPRPVELVYTVAGATKVGDRNCTRIEKKLAQPLPFKLDLGNPAGPGGQTLSLTDYGQTLCVDPDTGQVVSDQLHQTAQVTGGPQPVTLSLNAAVTLQETRQLSETELASRVKQAAAIGRVREALGSLQPGADNKKALAKAGKEAAAFHQEFPNSPYAPVVARLDEIRGQIQAQIEKEGRLSGLKGAPAPPFALKSLAGAEKTLAAYRGKIIVLNFFANW
jgi:hypothetical protein